MSGSSPAFGWVKEHVSNTTFFKGIIYNVISPAMAGRYVMIIWEELIYEF
ncbi:MAG: hypothetical protein LBR79_00950 [Oscillospiraceae bacterium]|nr:hypothetical protein [Oscillospiraceae bacterium]